MRLVTSLKEEDLYELLMRTFNVPRERVLIRYSVEGPHDNPEIVLEAQIVQDIDFDTYISGRCRHDK